MDRVRYITNESSFEKIRKEIKELVGEFKEFDRVDGNGSTLTSVLIVETEDTNKERTELGIYHCDSPVRRFASALGCYLDGIFCIENITQVIGKNFSRITIGEWDFVFSNKLKSRENLLENLKERLINYVVTEGGERCVIDVPTRRLNDDNIEKALEVIEKLSKNEDMTLLNGIQSTITKVDTEDLLNDDCFWFKQTELYKNNKECFDKLPYAVSGTVYILEKQRNLDEMHYKEKIRVMHPDEDFEGACYLNSKKEYLVNCLVINDCHSIICIIKTDIAPYFMIEQADKEDNLFIDIARDWYEEMKEEF